MQMEYIITSLHIVPMTSMSDKGAFEERLAQLLQLEEDRFFVGFYQCVEKDSQKPWHVQQIKTKHLQQGDMVLLYDSKFVKYPGKLQMHWLGPYVINFITDGGMLQLQQLDGMMLPKLVNGSRLKTYKEGPVQRDAKGIAQ